LAILIFVFGSWAFAGVMPDNELAMMLAVTIVQIRQCDIDLRSIRSPRSVANYSISVELILHSLLRKVRSFSEVRHSRMF